VADGCPRGASAAATDVVATGDACCVVRTGPLIAARAYTSAHVNAPGDADAESEVVSEPGPFDAQREHLLAEGSRARRACAT
jgi:hypothetical protein